MTLHTRPICFFRHSNTQNKIEIKALCKQIPYSGGTHLSISSNSLFEKERTIPVQSTDSPDQSLSSVAEVRLRTSRPPPLPTMDQGIEPSSHNESLALGLLLLGLVFLTFINPGMFRPKLFILLVACISQLPTVTAVDRMRMNVPLIVPPARQPLPKPHPTKWINSGLHPLIEKIVYLILMAYGFVILNLILWGVGIFLDLLVPFLPLIYAHRCFNASLDELDATGVTTNDVVVRRFLLVAFPNIAFFYAGFRKPQYVTQYMFIDMASILLGYFQQMVDSSHPQHGSRAPFAIECIFAGHLLVSITQLLYVFDSPIHNFRGIIRDYYQVTARFFRTNRRDRRFEERRSNNEENRSRNEQRRSRRGLVQRWKRNQARR